MDALVPRQMTTVRETLATDATSIRPLPCMGTDVRLQLAMTGEGLVTRTARISFL